MEIFVAVPELELSAVLNIPCCVHKLLELEGSQR